MPHPCLRRRRLPRRFDHGAPISGIDTRPMLFVALFIAVLFLLAASQTRTHALLVELPQRSAPPDFAPPYMVVSIAGGGDIALDGVPVPFAGLAAAIRAKAFDLPIVLLRAQPDTTYDRVAHVLDAISEAGVAPADICFDADQLEGSGNFNKSSYPSETIIVLKREPREPHDLRPLFDARHGGCELFIQQSPRV
jgi:biopolymer transport protein ExbD